MYCTTECHYQSKLRVQYATEAIGLRQNRDERQLAYGKCNQSPEKLEKDARVILRWLGKWCTLQEDMGMSAYYSDIIRCSRTLSHIGTWLERFQILHWLAPVAIRRNHRWGSSPEERMLQSTSWFRTNQTRPLFGKSGCSPTGERRPEFRPSCCNRQTFRGSSKLQTLRTSSRYSLETRIMGCHSYTPSQLSVH